MSIFNIYMYIFYLYILNRGNLRFKINNKKKIETKDDIKRIIKRGHNKTVEYKNEC